MKDIFSNEILSMTLCGILIVLSIIFLFMTFKPVYVLSDATCDDNTTCFQKGGYCDVKTKKCMVKKYRWYLAIPAIALFILAMYVLSLSGVLKKLGIDYGHPYLSDNGLGVDEGEFMKKYVVGH